MDSPCIKRNKKLKNTNLFQRLKSAGSKVWDFQRDCYTFYNLFYILFLYIINAILSEEKLTL